MDSRQHHASSDRSAADAVGLELLNNALGSITDEMSFTIFRTAHSGIVKDILDFSVAICDGRGRLIGQGATIALHLGSVPAAMDAIIASGSVDPGDIFILNDPYHGGVHLPDIFIAKPIFRSETLVGYALAVAHQSDVGGRVAGSNGTDSLEIFEEGLRLPPVKLYERGKANSALFAVIENNVRLPNLVLGDLRAQISACEVGEAAFLKLVERYTVDEMEEVFTELLAYSERLARAEIASWPDGRYEFEDFLDSDGVQSRPVRIKIAIEIKGDSLVADFAGTDPQVQAAINCPMQVTRSAVCAAVRCAMKSDVPGNDGYLRPITVRAPEGSLVNMKFPAACAARGMTAYRVTDVVLGALAKIVPDRIPAACEGGVHLLTIGGNDQHGPFVVYDIVCGTGGARPTKDGLDGIANPVVNLANTPVEVEEKDGPVMVLEYGFVPDTGGAGRYRGGLAIARAVRFLGEAGHCQVRGDRRLHTPWGLMGGHNGQPSTNELVRDGKLETLMTMENRLIAAGDIVRIATAGGGGYGNPLERDAASVLDDVIQEKVSIEAARAVYGRSIVRREDGTFAVE